MVKTIILCEGETDQALLGGYLEKVAGWCYVKNYKDSPFPKEPVEWYKDSQNKVAGIWQVGGNLFDNAIKTIFAREKIDHLIECIAVITDHDDEWAESGRLLGIESVIKSTLEEKVDYLQLISNSWSTISFRDEFQKAELQMLYLLVPFEEFGALETFMMNALSEQSVEKESVIRQSKQFVDSFKSEVYLQQRREKIKAELGVSLSVFSPDRVFTTMKELIDSVHWENFKESSKQFELLQKIY